MERPHIGPGEREFDPLGLVPIDIRIDNTNILSLDALFRFMAESNDLSRGLQVTDGLKNTLVIDGEIKDDCQPIYMKDDCAVLEYDYYKNQGSGRLSFVIVRQDDKEIVRPIPLGTKFPVAASIDAHDIIQKFKAADDLLINLKNIVD